MKEDDDVVEAFRQPRRFAFLMPQFAIVAAVLAGMIAAGGQLFLQGYPASGASVITLAVGFGSVLVLIWKKKINRTAIIWDGVNITIYPLIGDPVCVDPNNASLVISNDYVGVRTQVNGKKTDWTVAKGFFYRGEWEERKEQLKKIDFRCVIE